MHNQIIRGVDPIGFGYCKDNFGIYTLTYKNRYFIDVWNYQQVKYEGIIDINNIEYLEYNYEPDSKRLKLITDQTLLPRVLGTFHTGQGITIQPNGLSLQWYLLNEGFFAVGKDTIYISNKIISNISQFTQKYNRSPLFIKNYHEEEFKIETAFEKEVISILE